LFNGTYNTWLAAEKFSVVVKTVAGMFDNYLKVSALTRVDIPDGLL